MYFTKTEKTGFHLFMVIYLVACFTPYGISKGGAILGAMLGGFYIVVLSFVALNYFTSKKGV